MKTLIVQSLILLSLSGVGVSCKNKVSSPPVKSSLSPESKDPGLEQEAKANPEFMTLRKDARLLKAPMDLEAVPLARDANIALMGIETQEVWSVGEVVTIKLIWKVLNDFELKPGQPYNLRMRLVSKRGFHDADLGSSTRSLALSQIWTKKGAVPKGEKGKQHFKKGSWVQESYQIFVSPSFDSGPVTLKLVSPAAVETGVSDIGDSEKSQMVKLSVRVKNQESFLHPVARLTLPLHVLSVLREPFQFDGVVNDSFWDPRGTRIPLRKVSGLKPVQNTEVYTFVQNKVLYLGVIAHDKDIVEKEGISKGDVVVLDLKLDASVHKALRIWVSAMGQVRVSRVSPDEQVFVDAESIEAIFYNSLAYQEFLKYAKEHRQPVGKPIFPKGTQGWSFEVRIPVFKIPGFSVQKLNDRSQWLLNVMRYDVDREGEEVVSSWSRFGNLNGYSPLGFGTMSLKRVGKQAAYFQKR